MKDAFDKQLTFNEPEKVGLLYDKVNHQFVKANTFKNSLIWGKEVFSTFTNGIYSYGKKVASLFKNIPWNGYSEIDRDSQSNVIEIV